MPHVNRAKELSLGRLTWPEVDARLANGFDTVLVVLGATEQHGPHLTVATDGIIGETIAYRVAGELGGTLVAPLMPVGCSDEHQEFAGTISLRHETLAAFIVDVCKSLGRQGFRWIAVLSWHGGNDAALGLAETTLKEVASFHCWCQQQLEPGLAASRGAAEAVGIDPARAGAHAGHGETSLMLAISPDQVRTDRLEPGFTGDITDVWPVLTTEGLRPVTPTGILGDPRGASGNDGRVYLDSYVCELVNRLRSWRGG
jgi:creatinine amidohydrolase